MEDINLKNLMNIIFPKTEALIDKYDINDIDYLYYCLTHSNIDIIFKKLNQDIPNVIIINDELIIEDLENKNLKLIGKKRTSNKINDIVTNNCIDTIILPLTLIQEDNSCHFNFIVIKVNDKIIYRYEPHGKILSKYDKVQKKIDTILFEFFMLSCKIPNLSNYNYFNIDESNPNLGPQEIIINKNNGEYYLGCCAFWGLCYLIINIIPKKVVDSRLQEFDNNISISKMKTKTKKGKDLYFKLYQDKIHLAMVTIMKNMYLWLQEIWANNILEFSLHRIINPFSKKESMIQVATLQNMLDQYPEIIDYVEDGLAVIHIAAKIGLYNITKILIDTGCDIDIPSDVDQETPLHLCIKFKEIGTKKDHNNIFSYLIQNNVNINCEDKNGITPLFLAVAKNDIEIVNELINLNANINTYSTLGKNILHYLCSTPLFFKLSSDNIGLIEKFVELGISLDEGDIYHRTPLHLACENLNYDYVKDIIEICNKYELNLLDYKDMKNQTPYQTVLNTNMYGSQLNNYINHKDFIIKNKSIPKINEEDNSCDIRIKIEKYYQNQKKLLLGIF
ncbi:Ankyrin repeats (3 copies) [seawater metagenome]|uniref:Ankyrin repeats (3 copies) n=1 Tax=seawater metagenome TaxID=1561972 RepID=A0A5E8CKM4_9ZZZZ